MAASKSAEKPACDTDETEEDTNSQWEPLEMRDLLRLLQPVESSWKTLGRYLLRDELQCKIATIENDCFHNDASKRALDDVLNKWLECTAGEKRTWQTLCDAAEKYGDDSLEKYIEKNELKKNGEPKMKLLQRWFKDSILRTSWYNFAVELVGKTNTEIIRSTHYGGGDHSCLQRMLVTWYDSSTEHSWPMIIVALRDMDESRVIEYIESQKKRK